MRSNKKWYVRFVAGNPEIFNKVRTEPSSPMMRSKALETVSVIESHDWRGWIEDDAGNRIYETNAEKCFKGASA